MASTNTRADSLGFYLTGASSDGGTQTDPLAALGNYASSTEVISRVATISNAVANISIVYIAGANPTGNGTLTAVDANTVAWTAPGGTQGPSVAISNGQTVVLEDGTDSSRYIRVTRTAATAISGGPATVTLATALNNSLVGADVTTAEQAAGRTEYFAVMLKNRNTSQINAVYAMIGQLGTARISGNTQLGSSGAGSLIVNVGNFDDWPTTGFCRIETNAGALREIVYYSSRTSSTLSVPSWGRGLLGTSAAAGASTDNIYAVPGMRIAPEAPSPNPGPIQTIASKTSVPSGRTWATGINSTLGVNIGNMAAGAEYGLWIENTVIAGQISTLIDLGALAFQFTAS